MVNGKSHIRKNFIVYTPYVVLNQEGWDRWNITLWKEHAWEIRLEKNIKMNLERNRLWRCKINLTGSVKSSICFRGRVLLWSSCYWVFVLLLLQKQHMNHLAAIHLDTSSSRTVSKPTFYTHTHTHTHTHTQACKKKGLPHFYLVSFVFQR
jgi:hypothetical protein